MYHMGIEYFGNLFLAMKNNLDFNILHLVYEHKMLQQAINMEV